MIERERGRAGKSAFQWEKLLNKLQNMKIYMESIFYWKTVFFGDGKQFFPFPTGFLWIDLIKACQNYGHSINMQLKWFISTIWL